MSDASAAPAPPAKYADPEAALMRREAKTTANTTSRRAARRALSPETKRRQRDSNSAARRDARRALTTEAKRRIQGKTIAAQQLANANRYRSAGLAATLSGIKPPRVAKKETVLARKAADRAKTSAAEAAAASRALLSHEALDILQEADATARREKKKSVAAALSSAAAEQVRLEALEAAQRERRNAADATQREREKTQRERENIFTAAGNAAEWSVIYRGGPAAYKASGPEWRARNDGRSSKLLPWRGSFFYEGRYY